MSCSGCGGEKRELPRAEINLDPAVFHTVIKNLFGVAITGFKNLPWPNEDVAQLATLIAEMVAENERLRRILGLVNESTRVTREGDFVRIAFGPRAAYTLQIPAGTPAERKELAASLTAVAAELRRAPFASESLPGQMTFHFKS